MRNNMKALFATVTAVGVAVPTFSQTGAGHYTAANVIRRSLRPSRLAMAVGISAGHKNTF
jgi:hypothetical protein